MSNLSGLVYDTTGANLVQNDTRRPQKTEQKEFTYDWDETHCS